ncbi:MAG: hypothetical protein QHH24_06050 [Candidatus Bathyarchaeota archaeon]|nr:hypothetical protein [Candidatus Bathyarchaeota archaeon]
MYEARVRFAQRFVRFGVAILLALGLLLLGLFEGVGYHLYFIRETSFIPHNQLGYADASFSIDLMYNPVLYPLYWLMGNGHINGTYSTIYLPEGYGAGEFSGPRWGLWGKERQDAYIIQMLSWGSLLNLLFLAIITVSIEIVGKRCLYLVLGFGIFGFAAFELVGMAVGMVLGSVAVASLLRRPDNVVFRFWRSLWE